MIRAEVRDTLPCLFLWVAVGMLPCSSCSAGLSSLLDAVATDSVALLLTPAVIGNHLCLWG